jgi:hypothetical protein
MAIRIASLFASIGADTSGLERGLSSARGGMNDLAGSMKASGGGVDLLMISMNQAFELAGKLAEGIKKVYDTAREGAELEYARQRFDNLSESIGTTSRLLLGDMRVATKGTISDFELMASASDLMALGLAKSHDEVIRLTTVSGALGMNMNQLVLALTNQTTARFDQLGISVDGFDAKVKKLEATGLSAGDAFKEAFITQAEEALFLQGSMADMTIGDFTRMESSFKNFSDAYMEGVSRDLAPAIKELSSLFSVFADRFNANNQFDAIVNKLEAAGIATDQFKSRFKDTKNFAGWITDTEAFNQLLGDMESQLVSASNGTQDWADANDRVYESMNNVSEATDYIGTSVPKAMQLAGAAVDDLTSKLADAELNLSVAVQTFHQSVGDNLVEGLRDAGLKGDDLISRLEILDGLMGTNYTLEYKIELATGDLLDQLINDPDGFAEALAVFDEEYTFQITGIAEAQAEVDTLQGALDDLEKEYNVWVRINTLGSLPSGYGGGGGSKVPQFAHAMGGYELAGQPYIVGEAGPELFIPDTNGRVYSNASSSAMLGGGNGDLLAALGRLPTASDIALAVRDALLMVGA